MHNQSSLGPKHVHRLPAFHETKLARITSTREYLKYGRVEVIFLDYSHPVAVWVIGDLDREPTEGDRVLISYMEGRHDAPYIVGFVRNKAYTSNFITVKKDKIKIQLPVFGIGTDGSKADKDIQGHLLDDTKQNERAYIEISPSEVAINFPFDATGVKSPATIKLTASGIEINHPDKIVTINGGTKGIARVGDTVDMTSTSPTYGKITSGSSTIKVD
jgi:hypothetical protein